MFFQSLRESIQELKESTAKMFRELEEDLKEFDRDDLWKDIPEGEVVETVTETKHPDGSVTITKTRRYKTVKKG